MMLLTELVSPGHVAAVAAAKPTLGEEDAAFAQLQRRLCPFESIDASQSAQERTIVAIPSINFAPWVLDSHASELAALEERCLYLLFALRRPLTRLIVVTSLPVQERVVDYYLGLMPQVVDAKDRLYFLSPRDDSPRPLAQKVLEHPELLARLRALIPDRDRSFIAPYDVLDFERDLALALDVPVYGVDPRFARHGRKSGCRRLFARAGVAHPLGVTDIQDTTELATALLALREAQPHLQAAVVKLDDGVYGQGNRVVNLRDLPPATSSQARAAIDARVRNLPPAYVDKLTDGAVVEELITGEIRSPSVQMRILPDGAPVVISTHDQVLGGELGQTYVGGQFPADPQYAPMIVDEARKVGDYLAAEGVVGRFGVDFVVARRATGWVPYAVEINLREGGTSHPYGALWLLTGGSLDERKVCFTTPSGQVKHYFATDWLIAPDYAAIGLNVFLEASSAAGLDWNPGSQTGAIYFMLRGLEDRGWIGVVTIGNSADNAHEIYLKVVRLLDGLGHKHTPQTRARPCRSEPGR
jgi:hypothetical protein